MYLVSFDNIIKDPSKYVSDIFSIGFNDINDGDKVFKNIQIRGRDEFYDVLMSLFPNYTVSHSLVRMSPFNQQEPNFIHKDDMMGDITAILYLSESHPDEDGTTIYDQDDRPICRLYSKFNRMVAFESSYSHSRNILENFGEGLHARLIQVVFLSEKKK